VIFLARLAVDMVARGSGLGKRLLVDALSRCIEAAEAIGARVDPKRLMLLMKDLRATLKSVGIGWLWMGI
jgi:predicted GNAT family N-acyltransferase